MFDIYTNYKIYKHRKKMKVLLMTMLVLLGTALEQIHEVIIIGSGISGISASKVLTDRGVPHLMLEARNRTGGRITNITFDGLTVDLGAAYVHKPNISNPIVKLMKELNWTALPARQNDEAYFYQSPDIVHSRYVEMTETIYDMMKTHIRFRAQYASSDISVKDAAEGFLKHILSKEKPLLRDMVYWNLLIYGNVEGTELQNLSARQYQEDQSSFDMLPTGGYWKLLQTFFNTCKPQLKLNEQVIEIDYSEDIVKVKTKTNIYYAKKVISSLPLGVLQSKKVKFSPPLPVPFETALKSIGQGSENKLFVSFQEPFWNDGNQYSWLNFVRKNLKRSDLLIAQIYPPSISEGKHILLFFLGGTDNDKVDNLTEPQLKKFIEDTLAPYVRKRPVVKEVLLTKWHQDPYSLGSYTYYKVGGSRVHVNTLRKPLRGKVWFIGEHSHPDLKSLSQAAFVTGKLAAEEVVNLEKTPVIKQFFE